MYTKLIDINRGYQDFIGKEITAGGWVKTLRAVKSLCFIELNDGSGFSSTQIVFDNTLPDFAQISKLGVGSAVSVTGIVTESAGSGQEYEIKASHITVEGVSPPDYMLQKKRHSFEFLRTISHLRPRTNTFAAVFRVRSLAAFAIHKFFQQRNFVYVNTPIITGTDAEGAGEMFKVTTLDMQNPPKTKNGGVDFTEDFFGKMANLTVSGQLTAETFALAFRDVYTFGPTFRAENSNTTRHAAEFWMVEPEIAFADLENDKRLAEDMLKYVINYLLENAKDEMNFFNKFIDSGLLERLENVTGSDFGHITYTEAVDILVKSQAQFEYGVKWGVNLQTEHERYLTEQVFKKPIFVTDYPKDIKAFYMRRNGDGKTVAAMDLLVPGVGEIIGGSQREERLSVLETAMDEMGLNKGDYWWYLDTRRYGSVKHAGFGLGFERLLMYVTGMANIRDVIPFPRTVNSAEF
jgi:asparaginyl-tRNA synthetase